MLDFFKRRLAGRSGSASETGRIDCIECTLSVNSTGRIRAAGLPDAGKSRGEALREPFSCDKMEYYLDSAAEKYCSCCGRDPEELEEGDWDIIERYACNHIAIFLTWIIQNNWFSPEAIAGDRDLAKAVRAVKREKMSGAEFLLKHCDGILRRADLHPEIRPFVDRYYKPLYLKHYPVYLKEACRKEALSTEFTWEDSHSFCKMLNLSRKKCGV